MTVDKLIEFVNSFGLAQTHMKKITLGTENINSCHGFAIFMADYG